VSPDRFLDMTVGRSRSRPSHAPGRHCCGWRRALIGAKLLIATGEVRLRFAIQIAESGRQAVAAMPLRNAAERPERVHRSLAARGMDWRSVIDGLRPHNARLWQAMPLSECRRNLSRLRAFPGGSRPLMGRLSLAGSNRCWIAARCERSGSFGPRRGKRSSSCRSSPRRRSADCRQA
jgi:hypothetical protein